MHIVIYNGLLHTWYKPQLTLSASGKPLGDWAKTLHVSNETRLGDTRGSRCTNLEPQMTQMTVKELDEVLVRSNAEQPFTREKLIKTNRKLMR